ncbi:MAG: nucleoside deaminase [Firmicutes bacterium]|nr:nucleoside deaminase [Bacillota bacterium]
MDIKFMNAALSEAKKAFEIGETPIGAVIVKDDKIIARAYNRRETKKNALMHAEISAIDKACRKLGGWRLCGCDMYVTLEPCPMCAGAIIQARIENVFFGAYDNKAGAFGSTCDLSGLLAHKVKATGGILEEQSSEIIKRFFKKLRKKEI